MDSNKYFCLAEGQELGNNLCEKVDLYDRWLRKGFLFLLKRIYNYYYLASKRNGSLLRSGDQGQYRLSNTNHLKSILQAILGITCGQRAAWQPSAINSDYKSQAKTEVAAGVLDYFFTQKKLERYPAMASEYATLLSEGFVSLEWDATLGEDWKPNYAEGEDGQVNTTSVQKAGDLAVRVHNPIDLIRDPSANSYDELNWIITRQYVNKFDLIAKFPQFTDYILNQSISAGDRDLRLGHDMETDDSDLCPLFIFYHKTTSSVPEGKLVMFLKGGQVLLSSPMPYTNIPVYRICHTDKLGTPFAYTVAFDLLPLQLEYDKLCSIVLTNQACFGVQSIVAVQGTNISSSNMVGGMKLIEYPANTAPPAALQLTQTAMEIFNRIETIEAKMEKISGIPSLLRGQVPPNLQSGTSLAYLASQALQFNSPFQRNWTNLLEDLGSGVVQILNKFADAPRIMTIIGKTNSYKKLEFTKDMISGIDRVKVEVTNPLSKTYAGRIQIAQDLLTSKMIDSPEQYMAVLATGNLSPLTESKTTEILSIRRENEDLVEGKQVLVLPTDGHPVHMREHLTILDDPEVRRQPEIVQRVLDHVLEHQQAWQMATQQMPDLLSVRNIPPAPTMPPPPPLGGAANVPEITNPINPIQAKANTVQPPQGPRPPVNMPAEQAQNFEQTVVNSAV